MSDDISDDPMLKSDAMITETRIKVVNPLRKVLVATDTGVARIVGDVAPAAPWAWRCDRYLETEGRSVRCLALDPGTGTVLAGFAGPGAGLALSTDGGKTWDTDSSWPADAPVWSLQAPGAGRVLVGGGTNELHVGEVPEGNWRSLPVAHEAGEETGHGGLPSRVTSILRCPSRPRNWLATLDPGGVLSSGDDGATWKAAASGWGALGAVFTRGNSAVAATTDGLRRTPDGGSTWEPVRGPEGEVVGITVDAAGLVIAAVAGNAQSVLWSSADKGSFWEPFGPDQGLAPPPAGDIPLMADSLHPGVVYVAFEGTIYMVGVDGVRKLTDGLSKIHAMIII